MKLAYPVLSEPLVISENFVNVLVVENPLELRRLISCIKNQIDGYDGELVLSENAEILPFSKSVLLISDPFSLDLNSKKILSKINQEASLAGNEFSAEFTAILAEINRLAVNIGNSLDFEASFEPMETWEELVKLLDFHVIVESLSFPEQLLEYIGIHHRFMKNKLFIFFNLKACLSEDELCLFYKTVIYKKLNILLIEDIQRVPAKDYEKTVVIDKDLCII